MPQTRRRAKKPRPPLADVVRDELRRSIVGGTYAPGDKLPSETELAEIYNVSRVTLREAVRGLLEAGYVTRQHGLGTYVTKRPRLRNNLDVNFGVTHLIEAMGMTPGNRAVEVLEEKASERVARALGLEPEEQVVRVERVRTADGDPIVYSVEFIPRTFLPKGVEDLGALRGSLYDLLADLGHPVHHGIGKIKPMVADQKTARCLGLEVGAPVLYLEQVDYGSNDEAQLLALEWYRGEDVDMTVYRKGPTFD
jgi:DNA-binding GntR family transcriptional regulator